MEMKIIREILIQKFSDELPKEILNRPFTQVPLNIPSRVLELYKFDMEFKRRLDSLYELIEEWENIDDIAIQTLGDLHYQEKKLLSEHRKNRLHNNPFINIELHRRLVEKEIKENPDRKVYLIDSVTAIETDLNLSYSKKLVHRYMPLTNEIIVAHNNFKPVLERGKRFKNITYVKYKTVGLDELFQALKEKINEEELKWLE